LPSRFWIRLGKFGLTILLAYVVMAYMIVFTIIVREELTIVDAKRIIPALSSTESLATLEGQVRNVFGDPVPFAVLILGDHLVQADNIGAFRITNLKPGRHTLEIFAGEYAKYMREIQVEAGMNYPTIKYESGLWPQVFLVDFHVFYKENDEIFGMVGFANGTNEPIYIERASIINPSGEAITDIFHDRNGFDYYLDLSNKLEVVHEPQKALKWAPRMVQGGEVTPLKGYFPPGPYSLEVHYAFQEGHNLGQYHVLTVIDYLDLEDNWDPHLP
jgi:hypothetical protein